MNYNELKELLSRYGFCIENISSTYDRNLYCYTKNPLFLTESLENVFATARFALDDEDDELVNISWFDNLYVAQDHIEFTEEETNSFANYSSPKIPEKIEKRLNKIQLDIKNAIVKLKKQKIEEDFT